MTIDTTVVIRSVNERTEHLCKKLISDQGVCDTNIFIVNKTPFSAAMKEAFKIGVEQKKKWTFCVDADVLLRPGSVKKVLELADQQKQNVCQVQSFMLDKFFGGVRKGGVHVYRTSLLNKVIGKIPVEGKDIRPESYTLKQMDHDGYPTVVVPYVVGTHDDEQFNYDIYRKAFVQGVKHLDRAELLVKTWRSRCGDDPDFNVALKGFSDSIANTTSTYINSDLKLYKEKFKKSGFKEKNEMDLDEISLEAVEKKIQNWESSDLYFSYFPTRDGYDSAISGFLKKADRLNKRFGPAELVKIGIKKITR